MYLELFIEPHEFDKAEFPDAVEFLGRREVGPDIEVEVVRERISAVFHHDGSTVAETPSGGTIDLDGFASWAIIL